MDDREREHPDEGTIHAWLDGALDDDASRALEAHVATCRTCAERVAEARGLIAGASRIVNALDDAPSATGPAWGQTAVAPVTPTVAGARRTWRVTPARAAIAATVLVALGVSLTYERVAVDSQVTPAAQERASAPSTDAATAAAPGAAAPRDPLLDSALRRSIAATNPPRAVEPAPAPTLPVPTPTTANAVADSAAPARVAAGRAAIRAEREAGSGAAPDQLAGRVGGVARAADARTMAAALRADSAAARAPSATMSTAGSAVQPAPVAQVAAECYRVESANGVAATWGADALPLVVRVDSAGRGAVFTVAGQPTGSQATVTRAGEDSLLLRLRRIGYEGSLALGAPGDARAGVMRSRQLTTQLEALVETTVPARRAAAARRRPAPAAKEAAPAPPAPESAEVRSAITAAPAVPVVARRIGCPG